MNASLSTKFIEVQGVEQTFRTAKGLFPALREIDLTIAKGEFVALIGHSGCGKSTLLNLIAGLTTPTSGALAQPCLVLLAAKHALHGQVDVVEAGQPGQQRMVLEHHGALRPRALDLLVGAQQRTVGGRGQPGNQVEQSGLAAAREIGRARV